jgi:hypothetical protein
VKRLGLAQPRTQAIFSHKLSLVGMQLLEKYKENFIIFQVVASLPIPWFQRFKIDLWLKAAIDSLSRANQFELGSEPDSVS